MDRKNLQLNIAIGLVLILLLVVVMIFTNKDRKKLSAVKKVGPVKQDVISKPRPALPGIEKFEEGSIKERGLVLEKVTEEEEELEELEAVILKDLPIDLVIAEEEKQKVQITEEVIEQEIGTSPPETQPTAEDIKKLQEKDLIIY